MERVNVIRPIEEVDILNGDCVVVSASTSIVEQLSHKIRQAYYNNNVYFTKSWERLKQIIDTMHLDVIVVDRGYGSIIADIKSYCTIPVIQVYGPDKPEDSFADIRIMYSKDDAEEDVADAIGRLLYDGRDRVEFDGAVRCSALKVDMNNYETTYNDNIPIPLKPMETRLLFYLMKLRNRVALKKLVALHVWDMPEAVYTRTIDVHIKNLRKRLIEFEVPVEIQTIRNVGYRLTDKEMP